MNTSNYEGFLRSKHVRHNKCGFEVDPSEINSRAFDWQRLVVSWALRTGRALLSEDCGLGKSLQSLLWAEHVVRRTNKRVILFCPLAVQRQFAREAEKFAIGVRVKVCEEQSEVEDGITITNYEKLHHFKASEFIGVVLDECFAKGTLVDTPSGQVPIESIHEGDEIINASGIDNVSETHRREVKYAIAVTTKKGRIVSSPNHPFFTQRGWIGAQDLEPGDCVLQAGKAVRIVREGFPSSAISIVGANEILREILLSEMANEQPGAQGESPHEGNTCKDRSEGIGVAQERNGQCQEAVGANCGTERESIAGNQKESFRHIETHEAQTFRTWRKREGNYEASIDDVECTREWVGDRVCLVTGETNSRLSDKLQTRLSERRNASQYRSGWSQPQDETKGGRKEGCEDSFVRVEGIEVLELGNRELDKFRDADGKLYFYDIGATRHPSYSVNGLLVHNSQILKSFTGKTKRLLCDEFADHPYKLACSATPAPNDRMEIGNQSEFLGVMRSTEMLARWFINAGDKVGAYRLRQHGAADFWKWMSSWAVCLSSPADIGFDGSAYKLPPLDMHEHVVDSEREEGFLFNVGDKSISATNVHREKRKVLSQRADVVASLVNGDGDPWAVWCDTDYEADALMERIPDAIEVRGSMPIKKKQELLEAFTYGKERVIVTKPEIGGLGLCWDHAWKTTWFAGYSFERFYQSIRRLYRFGQKRRVQVHVVRSENEGSIVERVSRKEREHVELQCEVAKLMSANMRDELGLSSPGLAFSTGANRASVPAWMFSKG